MSDYTDLIYVGNDHARFMGWWFGYPDCCVEWFADLCERRGNWLEWKDELLDAERYPRSRNPARPEYLLCPACRENPAPVPEDRPADRWTLLAEERTGDWMVWDPDPDFTGLIGGPRRPEGIRPTHG